MNRIIELLFALFTISPVFAQEKNVGTQWLNISYEEALKEATKQGKPIFIDCYTKTCGPCMYYKKEIFPIEEIGEYMNNTFICIMKDMEEGDGLGIAKKYNVQMYPTFLVVDAQGKELYRVPVLLEPVKELIPTLELCQEMVGLRKIYDNGNRDPEFVKDFFSKVKKLNPMDYEKILGDYLLAEKRNELQSDYWKIFKEEIHNIEHPVFRYVLDNRKKFARALGKEEVYSKLYGEYASEFRMARMLGLDYDTRIAGTRIFVKEGIKKASSLLWRMQIYNLWNSGKGEKGNIMEYLERLNKVFFKFDTTLQMDIANDFGVLCSVAKSEEKKKMFQILENLKASVKDSSKVKRLQELQNYINR